MLYQRSKKLRNGYLNESDGKFKISILSQICSSYFENSDIMPSKITIRLNVKKHIRQIKEYRSGYPESKLPFWSYPSSYIQQVLRDLELECTTICIIT